MTEYKISPLQQCLTHILKNAGTWLPATALLVQRPEHMGWLSEQYRSWVNQAFLSGASKLGFEMTLKCKSLSTLFKTVHAIKCFDKLAMFCVYERYLKLPLSDRMHYY